MNEPEYEIFSLIFTERGLLMHFYLEGFGYFCDCLKYDNTIIKIIEGV